MTYVYDGLNRLTSASTTAASSTSFAQTYTYSKLGNITNKSDVGAYTYAETNYANPHAVTSVGDTTYTYDNNGNVTAIGSLDYTWDWRNRLASAERSGGGITTYGYDHGGQRVFKATGTATTSYPNRTTTSPLRQERRPRRSTSLLQTARFSRRSLAHPQPRPRRTSIRITSAART